MRRRDFITLVGASTAVWPLVAYGQQATMPVIGFLSGSSLKSVSNQLAAFQDALKEAGFVDGRNVRIEYRWAEQQYDRLPALAKELAAQGQMEQVVASQFTATLLLHRLLA